MFTTIIGVGIGLFFLALGLGCIYDKPEWLWGWCYRFRWWLDLSWSLGIGALMLGSAIVTIHISNYAAVYQSYVGWAFRVLLSLVGIIFALGAAHALLDQEDEAPQDQESVGAYCFFVVFCTWLLLRNSLCWWHEIINLLAIIFILVLIKIKVHTESKAIDFG